LTESPTGFDQSLPGRVVNVAGDRKTARTLKGLDERDRAVAEVL
jgi:hypothetical protein